MWPFVFIFLLAGLGLWYAGRKLEADARRANRWPVTDGVLESCEVVSKSSTPREEPSTWHLELRYSYEVDGVTYHSDRYAFGYGGGYDDAKHRRIAAALKASPKLLVRYDPAQPQEAVLNTEVPFQIAKLGQGLLVLAFISLLIAL